MECEHKNGNPDWKPASSSVSPLTPRPRPRVQIVRHRGKKSRDSSNSVREQWTPLDNYLPCHYFDYMAGTSTGGLISIMLGRLSMSVDECLEAYEILSDRVFGNPRWFHFQNALMPRSKYDTKVLGEVIKEIIKLRYTNKRGSTKLRQPNEAMCRMYVEASCCLPLLTCSSMVIASREVHSAVERVPYIFRSYSHPDLEYYAKQRNPGAENGYNLSKIALATSAAPFYFHSVALEDDDPDFTFLDGGLAANNPSQEAWESIRQLNNGNPKTVDIIVSIGTGTKPASSSKETSKRGLLKRLLLFLLASATDTYPTHEEMAQRSGENGFSYYRLNVEHGVGSMKLDEWEGKGGAKTLEKLRTMTQIYLDSSDAQAGILGSAEYLAAKRRSRSLHSDQDHWERYCHGVGYYCKVKPCGNQEKFLERQRLRRHIEEMHPGCHNIEHVLDQGKVFVDETLAA